MENENYIVAEINITEKEINENVRIINSFEEVKRKKSFGKIKKMIINMKMKKKLKKNVKLK